MMFSKGWQGCYEGFTEGENPKENLVLKDPFTHIHILFEIGFAVISNAHHDSTNVRWQFNRMCHLPQLHQL